MTSLIAVVASSVDATTSLLVAVTSYVVGQYTFVVAAAADWLADHQVVAYRTMTAYWAGLACALNSRQQH